MKTRMFLSIIVILTISVGLNAISPATAPIPAKKPPQLNITENGQLYTSIAKYMSKFVKLPEGAESFGLIGTSVAQFDVKADGSITNIKIINSVSRTTDAEMIRVLQSTSGKWIPGSENSTVKEMKREVSVVFKPNSNYNIAAIASKSRVKAREELLNKKDTRKAIRHYDKAIQLFPYELSFFAERGLCKYESGDTEGAKKDWQRITFLKKYDPNKFKFSSAYVDPAFHSLKGFAQLKQTIGG